MVLNTDGILPSTHHHPQPCEDKPDHVIRDRSKLTHLFLFTGDVDNILVNDFLPIRNLYYSTRRDYNEGNIWLLLDILTFPTLRDYPASRLFWIESNELKLFKHSINSNRRRVFFMISEYDGIVAESYLEIVQFSKIKYWYFVPDFTLSSSEAGSVWLKIEGQLLVILSSGVGKCDVEGIFRKDPGHPASLQGGVIGSEVEYCLGPLMVKWGGEPLVNWKYELIR